MTENTKPKKILAIVGVEKLPEADFRDMLHSSLAGLTANLKIFSPLPVELSVYSAHIDSYDGAIPAALDGSKTAVALKNKYKGVAIKDYTRLAHHVESVADNDMATFLLSGFLPKTTNKTPAPPASVPEAPRATPGPNTGDMKLKVPKPSNATSGDIRYGQVPAGGGVPTTWTEIRLGSWRPITISGLTPGAIYIFQARALGSAGLTDWSDPVSRMAT